MWIEPAVVGSARGVCVLIALAATTTALWLTPSATSHAPGCVVPRRQPPVGDTRHVYAITHGCVRLAVPRNDTKLPTVVVRQHDGTGRTHTRRFRLPDTNLDRASGSVGICGHDSTYVFVVTYPFVTIVAQELYDLGGRRECATDVDRALLWTGQLSRPPSLSVTWYTHRGPR